MIVHWSAHILGRYSHTNGLNPEAAYRFFQAAAGEQPGQTFTVNAADTILKADLIAKTLLAIKLDSGQMADLISKQLFKRTGDGQTMADAFASNILHGLGLADTQSPTDGIGKILLPNMQESQSGGDILAKTLLKFLNSEGQLQADALTATLVKALGLSDSQSPTDGIRKILLPNMQEGQSGLDVLEKILSKVLNSESQRQADTAAATLSKSLGFSDSILADDVLAKTLFKVMLEASGSTDDVLAKTLFKVAGDGAFLTDAAGTFRLLALILTDSMSVSDLIAKTLFKGLVDPQEVGDLFRKILSIVVNEDFQTIADSIVNTIVTGAGNPAVFVEYVLTTVNQAMQRAASSRDTMRRTEGVGESMRRTDGIRASVRRNEDIVQAVRRVIKERRGGRK